jgi:glycine/serine hydroxymethyltransferase
MLFHSHTLTHSWSYVVKNAQGISGAKMEKACDEAHITLNKNAVVGDVSAMNPGGVRIGELPRAYVIEVSCI